MVLDPLAALGVGASVVQFVDFSTKLISKATELYKGSRNALIEVQELHDVSLRLVRLNNDLFNTRRSLRAQNKQKKLPPAEEALQQVSLECTQIAEEFIETSQKLLTTSEHKAWKSCRQAFKAMWNKDGLEAMQRWLGQQREQLVIHLLVVISNNQIDNQEVLLKGTTRMESHILDAVRASNAELKDDLAGFSALLGSKRTQRDSTVSDANWLRWRQVHKDEVLSVFTDFSQRIESEKEQQITDYILNTLHFPRIRDRELRIHPAHARTFGWIFDTSRQHKPFSSFVEWVQSRDNSGTMYWVAGKPGSGKSTLMRFLVQDQRTKASLQSWSSSKPLLVASCFFWLAGTDLQKSFHGLIRSLLYDLVKQEPSLLPKVSPWRWKSCEMTDARDLADWTIIELEDSFKQLIAATAVSHNLAFFIDGLDEFNGTFQDHSNLINFLKHISRHEHTKICVSSRPWPVFQSAFSRGPLLRLEDLTHGDIKNYVSDTLSESGEFQSLQAVEPDLCSDLSLEIVNKAQGVFLWVYLVVRSLLQGVVEGDTTEELYVRLHQIPEDLDEFFRHIILGIEHSHRQEAAALFKIVLEIPSPTVLSLSFLSEALKNPDFWRNTGSCAPASGLTTSRITIMARRIESRCKGLLEVGKAGSHRPTADFLHRTARDFILTRSAQDVLEEYYPPDFNAYMFMCTAILAQLKMKPLGLASLKSLGEEFLAHFGQFEVSSKATDAKLMDDFLLVFEQQMLLEGWAKESGMFTSVGSSAFLALSSKIELYAVHQLSSKTFDLNGGYCHPIASRSPAQLLMVCARNAPNLLKPTAILLEKGANLDAAWIEFLSTAEVARKNLGGQQRLGYEWKEMARLFIRSGAPRKTSLWYDVNNHQITTWSPEPSDCRPLIKYIFGEDSQELIALWGKQSSRLGRLSRVFRRKRVK